MRKLLIFIISILFVSCSTKYRITKDSLKSEWAINRGFEISKLTVSKLHDKKGYPIVYDKSKIHICLVGDQNISDRMIQSSLEDYWEYRDSIDYNSGSFLAGKGNRKINFYKVQENVRWMKFPFKDDLLTEPFLDMKFEHSTWYKMSHFYPKQYEMDIEIYIYVKPDGELKSYQILK